MLLVNRKAIAQPNAHRIASIQLHGATLISVYQLGHHFGKDTEDQPTGDWSHLYTLYFNDGVNQIRVAAKYSDDPTSRENMVRLSPRAQLEKLALGFLDFFTHAW